MKMFVQIIILLLSSIQVDAANDSASYVGRETCKSCHVEQDNLWQGSHHDLAMQHADDETVLGDFSNITFSYDGITSKFYKHDDKFMVQTDGPDGKLHDYEIQYTFGVTPLQQYLIELDDGKLQALSIAWDTRKKQKVVNVGFIFIQMRKLLSKMYFTGLVHRLTGTVCVPNATRQI